jgi:quercetin dioxygenase-like cupin family protein
MAQATMVRDPVQVDESHYKVVSENDQVRVLRVSYAPHERSVMHEHPPAVAVFLSNARFRFTYPDGRTEERSGEVEDAIAMPAEVHQPENIGDTRAEVVLIELKKG